jgi:Circularly permutated YpsA SLOG family
MLLCLCLAHARLTFQASPIRKDSQTKGLTGSCPNRTAETTSCSKCFEKSYQVAKPALIEPDWISRSRREHGGYVPRGRKAEDGRIDDRYNLVELSTSSYPARTRKNIEESDGTVIFSLERLLSGGTKLTWGYAFSRRSKIFWILVRLSMSCRRMSR